VQKSAPSNGAAQTEDRRYDRDVPESHSFVQARSNKVVLTIEGRHSQELANSCAQEAVRLARATPRCEFVVDITKMTGYDPAAREVWSNALAAIRGHVGGVVLVGASALQRMVTAAVCLYAKLPLQTAATLEEVFTGVKTVKTS
jgi:hypothetical protein